TAGAVASAASRHGGRRSAQMFLQTRHHVGEDDRFGEKGITTNSAVAENQFFLRDGGSEKNDRHRLQLGILPKTSGQFAAVHIRHHYIQQDQIRQKSLRRA